MSLPSRTQLHAALIGGVLALATAVPARSAELGIDLAHATTVNFNLTGLSPSAPYQSIGLRLTLSDVQRPPFAVWIAMYGEQDGQSLITAYPFGMPFTWNQGVLSLQTANDMYAPMLDGVFSLKLWADGPGVDLASAAAKGITWNPDFSGYAETAYQTVALQPVPEPASTVLLGLGLAALVGVVAQRRRS